NNTNHALPPSLYSTSHRTSRHTCLGPPSVITTLLKKRPRHAALLTVSNSTRSGTGPPSAAALHELTPTPGRHLDTVLAGRRADPAPGCVALLVGHALDLVEARDRIADVAGVVQRLLALLCKREGRGRHPVLLTGAQAH